jgi:D-inositol-3-phosphate glycosyltransferase
MNIAMISVHSSPVGKLGTRDTGGMSVYIRELAAALGKRGHRVDVFTRTVSGDAPGCPIALAPGVRLVPLEPGPPGGAHPAAPDGFFRQIERFRAAAPVAYDLVHTHYWLSGRVGRTAGQAWGAPHVATFHTLGAIKKLVHADAEEEDAAVRLAVEREVSATADRVLVTSLRERDNLLRYYETPPDSVSTVPCGVNLELFRPMAKGIARRRIGAHPEEALLLYVGRFAPEKGVERLIRAMGRLARIARLRLIVVGGDGDGHPATRAAVDLSRALGVADRIAFAGRVEQDELPSLYGAADLLVLPSSYESFGMVALEAMACGTPVVATRVGAMEEIVRSGENGWLVDGFDPSSLAETLAGRLDPAKRLAADPMAIRRSVGRYEWTRVAGEVLEVYGAAAAARAGGAGAGKAPGPPAVAPPACCGCGRRGRA